MAAGAVGVGGKLTGDITAAEDVADTHEKSLASPFGKSITQIPVWVFALAEYAGTEAEAAASLDYRPIEAIST